MFKTVINNFHLEKLVWIIKSKLLYMILAALIGGVAGGVYASVSQTSTYQAEISFYVYSKPDYVTDTGVNLSSSDISQANSLLASYMQILNSATFLNKVKEYTGLENYSVTAFQRRIKASSVSNTAVFKVTVMDANPMNAMTIANAIGDLAPAEIISIVKSGGIEVLDEAELPTVPYASTSVTLYIILGAAVGFILVAVWAVITGLLNTTIRRIYELEELFTIPVLGTVPFLVKKKNLEDIILSEKSGFEFKEAYSDIRVKLLLSQKEEACPVYAITSADCEEGKTTSALNLAIAFSNLGKKVLLIDADLRKSNMAQLILGKEDKAKKVEGLSEYLANKNQKLSVHQQNDNLDVVLAGQLPTNPAELLACDRWYDLLKEYKKEYDVIFIDMPALGLVSDALSSAREVTSYLLVVRELLTRFEREEMIVRKLEEVDAEIGGFVYNGISAKSQDYNYKKYGKEYK